ncbi:hypothetical protein GEMRC1_001041 [Eukaryota sp. GEM-RC1]
MVSPQRLNSLRLELNKLDDVSPPFTESELELLSCLKSDLSHLSETIVTQNPKNIYYVSYECLPNMIAVMEFLLTRDSDPVCSSLLAQCKDLFEDLEKLNDIFYQTFVNRSWMSRNFSSVFSVFIMFLLVVAIIKNREQFQKSLSRYFH